MAYFQDKYTRDNPRWGMYGDPTQIGEGFSGAVQDIAGQYIPLSGPFQQLLQRGFAAHARVQAGNVPIEQYYSDPANVEALLKRPVDLQKYAFGFLGEVKLPSGQPLPQDLSKAIVGGLEIPPFLQTAIKEAGMSQADIETASRLKTVGQVQDALLRAQIPGMLSMARGAEQRAPAASGLEDVTTQAMGMIQAMYKYDPAKGAGGSAYMLRSGYIHTRQIYKEQMQAGSVGYAVRALGTDAPDLSNLPKDFGAEASGYDLGMGTPVPHEMERAGEVGYYGDIAIGKGVVQQQPWIKKLNIPSAGLPLGIRTRETGGAFAFGSGQGVSPFGERGLREAVLPKVEAYKRPIMSIVEPEKIVDYEPATRVTYPKGTTNLPQVIIREQDMPGVEQFVQQYEAGEFEGNLQAQAYYKALRNVSGSGGGREQGYRYGADIVTKGTRPFNLGSQEFDEAMYGQGEYSEDYLEEAYDPGNLGEGAYWTNWKGEKILRRGTAARNLGPGMRYSRSAGEQELEYYESVAADINRQRKISVARGIERERPPLKAGEVAHWYSEPGRAPSPVEPSGSGGRRIMSMEDPGKELYRYPGEDPSYGHEQYEQRAAQDVPASDIELAMYEAERELAYERNIPESFSSRLGERYSARGIKTSHADLATPTEKRVTRNVGRVIAQVEGRAPAPPAPEPPIPEPTVPRMWSYNVARAVQSAASGSLTYSASGKFKPSQPQIQQYSQLLEELGQKYSYDVEKIPYIPGMGYRESGVFLTSKATWTPSPPPSDRPAIQPAREEMLPGTQKYKSVSMQPRRTRDEFEWDEGGVLEAPARGGGSGRRGVLRGAELNLINIEGGTFATLAPPEGFEAPSHQETYERLYSKGVLLPRGATGEQIQQWGQEIEGRLAAGENVYYPTLSASAKRGATSLGRSPSYFANEPGAEQIQQTLNQLQEGTFSREPVLADSPQPWPEDTKAPAGWKLHLATDQPEKLSRRLTEEGYVHKVGRSGQEGKDITAYIGGRREAEEAARRISRRHGGLLLEPHGETLRDDISLAHNVMGRFDPRDPEFAQYGQKGIPYLHDDALQVVYGGMERNEAMRRSYGRLEQKYGEFFTGTPEPARQQNVPLLPAGRIVEPQVAGRSIPQYPVLRMGAGGGGQLPPTEFPHGVPAEEPFGPEGPGEGFEAGEFGGMALRMPRGYVHRPEYRRMTSALSEGRGGVAAFPPGWGKTAFISFAQIAKGPSLNIVVAPQTTLASQLAKELTATEGTRAFHLPGWPGLDKPELVEEYTAAHEEAMGYIEANVQPDFDERGNISGWSWTGEKSATLVMTPEKFANFPKTRRGGRVQEIMRTSGGTITFDESQEMYQGRQRRYLAEQVKFSEENFPNIPVLTTGGTLTGQEATGLAQRLDAHLERKPLSLEHLNWKLQVGGYQGRWGEAGAELAARVGGGSLFYGSSTAMVEEMGSAISQAGMQAEIYHKGEGVPVEKGGRGPLTTEQLQHAEAALREGLDPDVVYPVSSAAGLGLNVPVRGEGGLEPLRNVGIFGPTRMSDIAQYGARIRPRRDPSGEPLPEITGEVNLIQDPKALRRWSNLAMEDMLALNEQNVATAFVEASSRTDYSVNWRTAGGEIQEQLGESLSRYGVSRFRGSMVFDMLEQAGLIKQTMVPVGQGPEGEVIQDLGWEFKEVGSIQEVQDVLSRQRFVDPFAKEQGQEQYLSFQDYKEKAGTHLSREYGLQAAMAEQLYPLTQMEGGQEFAGEQYKQAIGAYLGEDPRVGGSGVTGLGGFVEQVLPQNIANAYVNAIRTATERFDAQSDAVKNTVEAQNAYTRQVQQINQMVANSPQARALATQALTGLGIGMPEDIRAGITGATPSAQVMMQGVGQALAQAPPPIMPIGGGGGGGGGGGRGTGSFWGRMGGIGSGLYGAYIAQRMFRMFGGDYYRGISEYAAIEDQFAPLDFYGQADYQVGGPATYNQTAANLRYMQGQGGYQLFGAPMQAFNQLQLEHPSFARGMSALGISGGILGGGLALSSGLMGTFLPSMFGAQTAAGGALMAGALPVAGAVAGGVAAYYGINELQMMAYNQAYERGDEEAVDVWAAVRRGALAGMGRPSALLEKGLLDEKRPIPFSASFKEAEAMTKRLGGQASMEELVPYLQGAARMFGKSPREFTEEEEEALDRMYLRAEGMGIQAPQYLSQATQAADLMGLYEGTEVYAQAALQFGDLTQVQQQARLGQLQQQYQRGQMLAPYLGTRTGTRMAAGDIFGARAQTQMLEMFGRFGGDVNAFAGFRGGEYVTQGQDLAQMAEELGTVAVQQMGELVAPMLEFGAIRPENISGTMRNLNERFGGLDRRQMLRMGDIASMFGGTLLQQGFTGGEYQQALGGLYEQFSGYTPQQWGLTQQIIGGDLRAQSWASWYQPEILADLGMGVAESRLFDVSGNRIYETSGLDMMRLVESTQAPAGRQGLNYLTMPQRAQQFLGISDTGMTQAYLSGGTRGAQDYARERSYQLSQASAGITLRGIELQEQYLWGGGQWTGTPAAGSLWGLQDQQRQMGYEFQMADFRSARQRQQMTYDFANRQAGLQYERMGATQDYQRWQFGFQWAGMQQQRGWAREDWQMDDTRRSLSFGWQMEDINEALRFAGGRERRQLLRQRERAVTTENLDEQQITTQRERQQQLWAKEDERFQKQVEYAEKMMDFDRRQWELSREQRQEFHSFEKKELARSMEEYKKRFELEGQIISLQRDHQAESLELQKQAAAIQAEQARIQHELDKVMTENARTWGDIEGYMSNINNYNNLDRVLNMLVKVLGQMAGLSPEALQKLGDTFDAMKNVPATGWFNRIQFEKAQFE